MDDVWPFSILSVLSMALINSAWDSLITAFWQRCLIWADVIFLPPFFIIHKKEALFPSFKGVRFVLVLFACCDSYCSYGVGGFLLFLS